MTVSRYAIKAMLCHIKNESLYNLFKSVVGRATEKESNIEGKYRKMTINRYAIKVKMVHFQKRTVVTLKMKQFRTCSNPLQVVQVKKNQTFKAPVRHTLQPLCDLSATDNFHRSQRSQQGRRSVLARLQRSRRLVGDLAASKSVAARFLNNYKNLAATDLVADRSR